MSLSAADVAGSWRLAAWRVEYPDGGPPEFPFGADADGLLVYASDGWMAAFMSRRERSPLSDPSARRADLVSKARVLDEVLAYAGRWRLEGDVLYHDVVISLNPVLAGTAQVRHARVADSRLSLVALEPIGRTGAERRHVIDWVRAGSREG